MTWLIALIAVCASAVCLGEVVHPIQSDSGPIPKCVQIDTGITQPGFTGQRCHYFANLCAGDTWRFLGRTYFATFVFNEGVCENRCAYGINFDARGKCGPNSGLASSSTDIFGEKCLLPDYYAKLGCDSSLHSLRVCDVRIAHSVIEACNKLGGKMLGVAIYRSKDGIRPSDRERAQHAANELNSISTALIKLASDQSQAQDLIAQYKALEEKLKKDFELVGRPYPVPIGLIMPPPFCQWSEFLSVDAKPEQLPPTQDVVPPSWPEVTMCDVENAKSLGKINVCMSVSSADMPTFLGQGSGTSCQIKRQYSGLADASGVLISATCKTADGKQALDISSVPCVKTMNSGEVVSVVSSKYYPYKKCLSGFPEPADINAAIPYERRMIGPGGEVLPVCTRDSDPTKCAPCDLGVCVDFYPFGFNCEAVSRDRPDCQRAIKDFCLTRSANKREYVNFKTCMGNYDSCRADPSRLVEFNEKDKWQCALVNKALSQ